VQRGAGGQGLHELDVRRAGPAARLLGVDEAEGPDDAARGADRRDDVVAQPELPQARELLLVGGHRGQQLVRDVVDHLGPARADDARGAGRGVGVGRVAGDHLAGDGHLLGVGVRHGHRSRARRRPLEGQRAPVGHGRHRRADDGLQGGRHVERGAHLRAGGGQELRPAAGGLGQLPLPGGLLGGGLRAHLGGLRLGTGGDGLADELRARCLAAAALGDLPHDAADAEQLPVDVDGVAGDLPLARALALARLERQVRHGLSCRDHLLEEGLRRHRVVAHQLLHGPAEVGLDAVPADAGERLVDALEAQVAVPEGQADRRLGVDRVERRGRGGGTVGGHGGRLALGELLDDRDDARDVAGVHDRVVARLPAPAHAQERRRLAALHQVRDGPPGGQDLREHPGDLPAELSEHLLRAAAQVLLGGQAVHRGQDRVDRAEAELRVPVRQADRRVLEHGREQRQCRPPQRGLRVPHHPGRYAAGALVAWALR
jgi:hypothetical protein